MHKHINAAFDAELHALKDRLLAMGRLVDDQVSAAVNALGQRDGTAALGVIAGDHTVNNLEMAIDEQCIRMLVLQQPAASDLRFVAASLKMVTDLERIGDLAKNIAERLPVLVTGPPLPSLSEVPALAAVAQQMLRDVLAAFVNADAAQARAVLQADVAVDGQSARLQRDLEEVMRRDPTSVARGVASIFVVKHIERMADHATNIAEMVVYLVQGNDVRHAT